MLNDLQDDMSARHLATAYLANERTFLAWLRTSFSLVGLGFAVAKFDIWLRQLGGQSPARRPFETAWTVTIGLFMIIAGGVLPVIAAWQYGRTNKRIAKGNVRPSTHLVITVTLVVVGIAGALFLYLFLEESRTKTVGIGVYPGSRARSNGPS